MATLDELEKGLKRYYQLMGAEYDEGNGLKAYCEENGFEDMKEELIDNEVDDCMLLEFDENIPFKKKYDSEDDKKRAIYTLLQKIYANPNCDFNEESNSHKPLKLTANDFKVKTSNIKSIHSKQLQTIFTDANGMANDKNILKVLAISEKVNAPYLIYCADLYSRDRISAHSRGKSLSAAIWAKENKHCLQIAKIGNKERDIIQHAVTSFFHRINPQLLLNSSSKICDSLQQTTKYLATAIAFVYDIALKNNQTCPFQFDTCIGYNEVRINEKKKSIKDAIGGGGGDSDSDDSAASNGFDGDNDEMIGAAKDTFGNIKEKLQKEECLHSIGINDDDDASKRSVRAFKKTYQTFKTEQVFSKYKDKEYREYPRNHRFCSFVDRRRKKKKKENDDEKTQNGVIDVDEIIFFEPPKNCNVIPKNAVPLWFFDSSKTCIVPNIGYNKAMMSEKVMKASPDLIHSGFPAGGSLLILSFHVESVDNIRCYLYLNGQMTRFFAEDVVNLLPRFFEESKENQEFAKSKEAKEMIEEMKAKLRDLRFEAFYNEYKLK